ncbi:MAG: putative DNA modification/repair radical SAM protein [Pseudobacteriovorax sp.]|nr:putative DNA modification/repair radical SAM protein [Pseudobacteriovorax sp.]
MVIMGKLRDKLAILADAAKYDASCASSGARKKSSRNDKGEIGSTGGVGICHSYTPDGRCVSLLKVLFTNHCIFDCSYCVNRASSPSKRASFTVEELVWITMEFYKRNYIEGLFLSSGVVGSSDDTMQQLVEVARRLRVSENFRGYIHLKAVAGCSQELIRKASLFADRISSNIEMPKQKDLDIFAPGKSHKVIEKGMSAISDVVAEAKEDRKANRSSPISATGQSTQFIVGATPDSDASLLSKANYLYQGYQLKRVYYSAYSPIPDSDHRLPGKSPPLQRENRLYQADWLMRFYGFSVDEIVPDKHPNLDLNKDPKHAWALQNRELFPVDINRAEREMLMRVPGLGIRSVDKILKARRYRRLTLDHLRELKVRLSLAKFFILVEGPNPFLSHLLVEDLDQITKKTYQPSLFDSDQAAKTGEV